jgi:Zn-finger nucleic acid-binding protein
VFLGHQAFAELVSDADARRSQAPFTRRKQFDPDVRAFACPDCRANMARASFGARSGIFLDACVEHGTWFDPHELDDALDFVRSVGLEEIRRLEAEEHAKNAARERAVPRDHTITDARRVAAQLQVVLLSEQRHDEQQISDIATAMSGNSVDLFRLISRLVFRP